jgi:threonyl-tRNA synthetase
MGKKNKDSQDQEITLQKTAKFSVLEVPGVTQPSNDDAKTTTAAQEQHDSNSASTKQSQKQGLQGRRAKASTGPRMDDTTTNLIGGNSFETRTPNPKWIKDREETYAKIALRRQEELGKKVPVPIKVVMPDGNVFDKTKDGESFMAWKTSPYDVACVISQGLADASVVARVTYESYVEDYDLGEDGMEGEDLLADAMEKDADDNGATAKAVLWDLTRPLVGNVAKLELLKFESDADAKTVFWHSSAHMLGEALEHLYGCRLTIGPPLKGGFYYDSYMGTKDAFKEEDCKCCRLFSCIYCLPFACPFYLHYVNFWFIYTIVSNRCASRTRSSENRQSQAKVRSLGRDKR